jgi:hypothetical protein
MQTVDLSSDKTLLENESTTDINIQENINGYYHDKHLIDQRLEDLDEEWSVERIMEIKAASLTMLGLALGISHNKRWFILPLTVSAILMNQGLIGFNVLSPLFRQMGLRTRAVLKKSDMP